MRKPYFRHPLLAALLMIAGTCAWAQPDGGRPRRAPAFSLVDWRGTRVSLDDLRGKSVVLQFFQVGCPVCQREAPLLEEIYQEYKDRGVVVLGISHDTGGRRTFKDSRSSSALPFPF